jgi:outer membrane protein W
MNGKLLTGRTGLAGVAMLLVPVLALAQNPQGDTGINGASGNAETVDDVNLAATRDRPWRLRFDFSWVNPSADVVIFNAGGTSVRTGFGTGAGAGLRGEYLFSSRLGVEVGVLGAGSVGVTSRIFGGTVGSDVEVSGFAPFTVGFNVHLTPEHAVDLYIGPQLALVRYSSVDVWTGWSGANSTVSIENDVGWGVILGLDVPLGNHGWMIQANVRYIDTDMKNSREWIAFDSEFNPVILSVGFGYRF